MRKLYLATTDDKYELPVAVSDTPAGLAQMLGVSKGGILSVISHAKQHRKFCVYHRIEYTEREWNE